MEGITPDASVTVVLSDGSLHQTRARDANAYWFASAVEALWLVPDAEGVAWCRGWDGPAVDALRAAQALA